MKNNESKNRNDSKLEDNAMNTTDNGADNKAGNDDVTEEQKFFDDLVERCKTDPQAFFEGDAIKRLAALKMEELGVYESVRERLKRNTGVRMGVLDSEVAAEVSRVTPHSPTQRKTLIDLIDRRDLFHTPDKIPYADVQINGIRQTYKIDSKEFRDWLEEKYYRENADFPGEGTVKNALNTIKGMAKNYGAEREVFLRVGIVGRAGSGNEKYYLDLCNEQWEAVEIDSNGWRVLESHLLPIRFRRTPNMEALPRPSEVGDINALREFLNVSVHDMVLVVNWALATLIKQEIYPILVVQGGQGASKTTFCKFLRALLDPNCVPLRTLPRNKDDLFTACNNNHIICFDNVADLRKEMSHNFCQIATGGGIGKRKQYADEEEVAFRVSRPILLNGIGNITPREDLADRTICIQLETIPEENRRSLKDLQASFEVEHPRLLGVLLDALSTGLRHLPGTKSSRPSRFVEFCDWSVACESAFPWESGKFEEVYADNRNRVAENNVDHNETADAVRMLMEGRSRWLGTASELLKDLENIAGPRVARSRNFPKIPNHLSEKLNRAEPFLRHLGIEIERFTEKKRKLISIRKKIEEEAGDLESGGVSSAIKEKEEDSFVSVPGHKSANALPIPDNDNRDVDVERHPIISYQPGGSVNIDSGTIYHGDNLLILREMAAETIDLIATDPPFNTGRDFGKFDDRFESPEVFVEYMRERVREMHRILKPTGSIYLHCDHHASYYLKVMLDEVFGEENFRNDIIWCYTGPANVTKHFPRKHDSILFYAKSENNIFNKEQIRIPYKHLSTHKGKGKKIFKGGHDVERLKELQEKGKIPESWWTEFSPVGRLKNERTGYPTQKPLALYERIIKASSNPGNVVLDPFAGSGTTMVAARNTRRRWIGIDASKNACEVAQRRLGNVEETRSNDSANSSTPEAKDIPEEQLREERQNGNVQPIAGCDIQDSGNTAPLHNFANGNESRETITELEKMDSGEDILPGGNVNIDSGTIYHGDNLPILREMEAETVDLIATDPPFNTGRDFGEFDDRFEDFIEWMRERVSEMRRILRPTGSLYLHCDHHASHYLKVMMDEVFGAENFRNEIAWCYSTSGRSSRGKRNKWARKHDTLLWYAKDSKIVKADCTLPCSPEYIASSYRHVDSKGRKCRIRINHGKERVYYPDEGINGNDWWTDIPALAPNAKEKTGYPTQKPVALYERIIEASSNPGDIVLDPFAGSGTTLMAARNKGRRWIGIDKSKEACEVAQKRLGNANCDIQDSDNTTPLHNFYIGGSWVFKNAD